MIKFQNKYKNFMSQMLGVVVNRLKAVRNTMEFSLLFIS